jgi:iron complex transport system substrate-binding protein
MNGHPTPRRLPVWLPLSTVVLILVLALAFTLAGAGCDSGQKGESGGFATITDDNGAEVAIPAKPERIVSTSPAATQILFALGVGDRVLGVNQWDDYPAEVANLPKVADMQVNIEAVMALSPDLVLGAAGQEEALATIQAAGAAVVVLNPATVEGIYNDITAVGKAVGAQDEAVGLIESMRETFAELSADAAATGESPSVFYAIDDTLYTCGLETFVDELLTLASATNVASQPLADGAAAVGYFPFTPEQLVAADPDIVILGAFYGGVEKFTSDSRFAGLTAVKEGRVFALEEQYDKLLTLAAPRIVEGFRGLVTLIHPAVALTD